MWHTRLKARGSGEGAGTWKLAYWRMQKGWAVLRVMACSHMTCSGHCTTPLFRIRFIAYCLPVVSSAHELFALVNSNVGHTKLHKGSQTERTCDDGDAAEGAAPQHRALRDHQALAAIVAPCARGCISATPTNYSSPMSPCTVLPKEYQRRSLGRSAWGGGAEGLDLVEVAARTDNFPRLGAVPCPLLPLYQQLRWQLRRRPLALQLHQSLPHHLPQSRSVCQPECCPQCYEGWSIAMCSAPGVIFLATSAAPGGQASPQRHPSSAPGTPAASLPPRLLACQRQSIPFILA